MGMRTPLQKHSGQDFERKRASRPSGWLIPAACAAVLIAGVGCSNIDEWLPESPDGGTSKSSASSSESSGGSGQGKRDKLRAYYARQTRPKKASEVIASDPIVRCSFAGGSEFMRRSDCTLRGGKAGD